MSNDQESAWEDYYKKQEGRLPRRVFVDGLVMFEKGKTWARFAVDLGCGNGTETYHLLKHGWRVLAVDREPGAITRVRLLVPTELQSYLETLVVSLEDLTLPLADFVYAGYSLPFCHPAKFDKLWETIMSALQPGGRFAGQLFGVNDTWATNTEMTFHTREQVERFFEPFDVEFFREEDEDGNSSGGPKHWHVFHVIARKKTF